MKDKMGRNRAFTLIELLIVVAIAGIFAGTQFALMTEGVRRHDSVARKAAIQGEARNILEVFARDARAAAGFPDSVAGVPADPEDVVVELAGGEGDRTVAIYSLEPGNRIRAGKDGPDAFLQQHTLTRTEWRIGETAEETGRRVLSRVVNGFECKVMGDGVKPLVACSLSTAEVSDGKRLFVHLASAFAPRVDETPAGEEVGE
jgi:prepilin-type N-terminal cleavage/methylation domain-containing protein